MNNVINTTVKILHYPAEDVRSSPAPAAASGLVPARGIQPPIAAIDKLDARTREAIGEMLAEGESENTRRSYQSAARYWVAWWEFRYGADFNPETHLPMAPEVVLQFIADHARRLSKDKVLKHELPRDIDLKLVDVGVKRRLGALALQTLEHRLAALARLHRSKNLDSPTDNEEVRRLLRSVRSAHARRREGSRGKDALTLDKLGLLLASCDASPAGVRDRALLLFAFASGGRRRSEVAGADLGNLRTYADGYSYNLNFSKTNRTGDDRPENHKPILGEAAAAMREWLGLLNSAGYSDGPIFRRIRRGGHIQRDGLSSDGIWQIVHARCRLAGLPKGAFSPHSLRSGFMTEAAEQKVPLDEVMAFSDHRDVKTALSYVRRAEMKRSRAANLLAGGADEKGRKA